MLAAVLAAVAAAFARSGNPSRASRSRSCEPARRTRRRSCSPSAPSTATSAPAAPSIRALRRSDAAARRRRSTPSTPPTPTARPPTRARTPAGSTSTATSRTAGAAGAGRSTPTSPARRAASEPETRAMMRLIRRLEPDVTLWYHQALSPRRRSSRAPTRDIDPRLRPRASGSRPGGCRTTAAPRRAGRTDASPSDTAFVVELRPRLAHARTGPPPRPRRARHRRRTERP